MSWISPSDVTAVYESVAPTQGLCDHVQGLAEVVIGTQTEPVSARLKAVMVEIITQFSAKSAQSASNTSGFKSERIDDYEYINYEGSGPLGLGLTEKAKSALRAAAGLNPLTTVWISRDDELEMAEPVCKPVDFTDPDFGQ